MAAVADAAALTDAADAAADTGAPAITLRPARIDDALCLGVLGLQVYLDTYARQGIRPTAARDVLATFSTAAMAVVLADLDTTVIVAEQGVGGEAHLIGFAQMERGAAASRAVGASLARAAWPAWPEAQWWRLARLYVQAPYTRRGLGRRLLQAAQADAAAGGVAAMWLTAWAGNHRALAFYAALGWADLGQVQHRIEDELHANRVLGYRLPGPAAG